MNQLERFIAEKGADRIAFIVLTVTSNVVGGQPVSMANVRQVCELASQNSIPVNVDTARFAENAYFIKLHEPGYAHKTIEEIAREMFSGLLCNGKIRQS